MLKSIVPCIALTAAALTFGCGDSRPQARNKNKDSQAEKPTPSPAPSPTTPSLVPIVESPPAIFGKWYDTKCYSIPTGDIWSSDYRSIGYLFRPNGTGMFYIRRYQDANCRKPFDEIDFRHVSSPIEYAIGQKIGIDSWEIDIKYLDGRAYLAFAIRDDQLHLSVLCDAEVTPSRICPKLTGDSAGNRSTALTTQFSSEVPKALPTPSPAS